ncbi:uncharacterized protein F4822DRAFT_427323 [Hypoxylon trugodes]|uniref:uncharacterized protein n=1 Tax=Hypoxylon trugodes TaxID=326681 RepID=UPI0021951FD5|nr:uncharacterized protein F4822DRAFT_427323 [Hypoxylon trugodes]KAI1391474.1 hypothetical protein F4822DRAFT_427323 [Hypoxylon trugodes]
MSRDNGAVSPPIYILKTTQRATTALSKALDALGYSRLEPRPDLGNQTASYNTYLEVTSSSELEGISTFDQDAKFILPRGSGNTKRGWWIQGAHELKRSQSLAKDDAWLAHDLFSEENGAQELLELDVLALETATQAENWVTLCKFLGMGYSVVERLGLWHFPQ